MSQVIRLLGIGLVAVGALILPLAPDRDVCAGSTGRCVLIDGGAHLGETISHFEQTRTFSRHAWEVFAFEANPDLVPKIPQKRHLTVLNKAIWTEAGEIEFFLADQSEGSSVFGNKKSGGITKRSVHVESVDFSAWIRQNFVAEDRVMVKLDIEGAEYPVLDKMLEEGTVDLIDRLYVEFHNQKIDVVQSRDEELSRRLRERGIEVRRGRSDTAGDWFRDWISVLERVSGRRPGEFFGTEAPA